GCLVESYGLYRPRHWSCLDLRECGDIRALRAASRRREPLGPGGPVPLPPDRPGTCAPHADQCVDSILRAGDPARRGKLRSPSMAGEVPLSDAPSMVCLSPAEPPARE